MRKAGFNRNDTILLRQLDVRAPRGTTLTAKSWLTEAPLRMLMNNLDPDDICFATSGFLLTMNVVYVDTYTCLYKHAQGRI
jgi:hypothetical protein